MKKNHIFLSLSLALSTVTHASTQVCPNSGEYDDQLPSSTIFPCSLPGQEEKTSHIKNFIGESEDINVSSRWSSTAFINRKDGRINFNFLSTLDEKITIVYKNCDEQDDNPHIIAETLSLSAGVPMTIAITSTCTQETVAEKWGRLAREDRELMENIARMVEISVKLDPKGEWSGHHVMVNTGD